MHALFSLVTRLILRLCCDAVGLDYLLHHKTAHWPIWDMVNESYLEHFFKSLLQRLFKIVSSASHGNNSLMVFDWSVLLCATALNKEEVRSSLLFYTDTGGVREQHVSKASELCVHTECAQVLTCVGLLCFDSIQSTRYWRYGRKTGENRPCIEIEMGDGYT